MSVQSIADAVQEGGIVEADNNRERRSEVDVVTGASAGVGRAITRAFGAHGASVVLLARSRDGLEGARRDVERLGGRALPTGCLPPSTRVHDRLVCGTSDHRR